MHTTCFTSFLVQNCWRRGGGIDQRLKNIDLCWKSVSVQCCTHLRNTTTRQGIIVYIEYKSFCPFVRIGSPNPSPASECVPSIHLGPRGPHSLVWEGVGDQIPTEDPDTLWYSMYIIIPLRYNMYKFLEPRHECESKLNSKSYR